LGQKDFVIVVVVQSHQKYYTVVFYDNYVQIANFTILSSYSKEHVSLFMQNAIAKWQCDALLLRELKKKLTNAT
jgi:hypothetical protein